MRNGESESKRERESKRETRRDQERPGDTARAKTKAAIWRDRKMVLTGGL